MQQRGKINNSGNTSPVFNQLLQLLNLVAELLSGREAFSYLHKEGSHLVAAQQACNTALQSMEHAGLHNSYTHIHTEY